MVQSKDLVSIPVAIPLAGLRLKIQGLGAGKRLFTHAE
jgi:hypothetical protein